MSLPTFTKVNSTNIEEVGHQGRVLWVRFKNGALWYYSGVTPAVYEAMMSAPSIGSYFASAIKPHYEGIKVEG